MLFAYIAITKVLQINSCSQIATLIPGYFYDKESNDKSFIYEIYKYINM